MSEGDMTQITGVETDAELIRGLQEALALEQAKNQVLIEQLVKAEDALAENRVNHEKSMTHEKQAIRA